MLIELAASARMRYSGAMRGSAMQLLVLVCMAAAGLSACRTRRSGPPSGESSGNVVIPRDDDSEQRRATSDTGSGCERPVTVYDGSITVNASDYVHSVARGNDVVDAPIDDLDRVITKSSQVRFTLDYPFEKPFDGVVTGEITLRRTIDAIRAGMRKMYEGTTVRDIPGMANKDVTGPYGKAFHVIDDLVIEEIGLCGTDSLSIFIGS